MWYVHDFTLKIDAAGGQRPRGQVCRVPVCYVPTHSNDIGGHFITLSEAVMEIPKRYSEILKAKAKCRLHLIPGESLTHGQRQEGDPGLYYGLQLHAFNIFL
jgi:hypothetical protein